MFLGQGPVGEQKQLLFYPIFDSTPAEDRLLLLHGPPNSRK